jgi:NADH:ubiquinone oxidoreductase subunit
MSSWLARIARAVTGPARERVGADQFGNVYYVVRKKLVDPLAAPPRGVTWHDLRKREERHVDWQDGARARTLARRARDMAGAVGLRLNTAN